jgi:hypothetical protein
MSNKELLARINKQYEILNKLTLEELESKHKQVLEKIINSKKEYNEFFGYYFSLVVELYSRCVVEDIKTGNKSSFNRLAEFRTYLQKKIED